MASSFSLSTDLLCQEMRDAFWEELRVAGFPSFTAFSVPGRKEEVF